MKKYKKFVDWFTQPIEVVYFFILYLIMGLKYSLVDNFNIVVAFEKSERWLKEKIDRVYQVPEELNKEGQENILNEFATNSALIIADLYKQTLGVELDPKKTAECYLSEDKNSFDEYLRIEILRQRPDLADRL